MERNKKEGTNDFVCQCRLPFTAPLIVSLWQHSKKAKQYFIARGGCLLRSLLAELVSTASFSKTIPLLYFLKFFLIKLHNFVPLKLYIAAWNSFQPHLTVYDEIGLSFECGHVFDGFENLFFTAKLQSTVDTQDVRIVVRQTSYLPNGTNRREF